MATQEFYIRNASETEARGPFNHEQLVSLVEAGQIKADTLYYEATTEKWEPVSANDTLKALLFPEKKKLTFRQKEQIATVNPAASETAPAISVDEMLAAAEGRTADTKDKRDHMDMRDRCAKLGTHALAGLLILGGVSQVLPVLGEIVALDGLALLARPAALVGIADLFLGVLASLQVLSIYPIVRFRAALGFGLLGFIAWAHGDTTALAALAGSAFGLYGVTLFLSYIPMGLALLLGFGGTAYLAYAAFQ